MTAPLQRSALLATAALALAGCGGGSGGGGTGPTPTTYTVGGTIVGLTSTGLVLRNNGGGDLTIAAGATSFTFAARQGAGSAYAVTVATQPSSPTQTCTVASASGTVALTNVTNVAITCSSGPTLGGTISGYAGNGLVLRNNGAGDLPIATGATSFAFPGTLAAGAAYAVTVSATPNTPWQSCAVANGTGTAAGTVTNVAVTCTTNNYAVAGRISGLTGSGLGLQLTPNSAPGVSPQIRSLGAGATTFAFAPIPSLTNYTLGITVQPTNPAQICTIISAGGASSPTPGPSSQVTGTDITNAQIDCGTTGTSVGGTVAGLTASGLGLSLNSGATFSVASGATSFTFPDVVASGTEYTVTIVTQPTGLACTLVNAEGAKGTVTVSSVGVKCAARSASPLAGTFVKQNGNGREFLTFWPDGTFTFVSRQNDASCPSAGNSIEYGTYDYTASTMSFRFADATTDGNGSCGFVHGGGANFGGSASRSADTLYLTSRLTPQFTQKWVLVTSTPSTLIGAFTQGTGLNGVFLVFLPDNTYLAASTQQRPGDSTVTIGYERACYSLVGGNVTFSKASSCLPDGQPVLVTNGGSITSGSTYALQITDPNTIVAAGSIVLHRILSN